LDGVRIHRQVRKRRNGRHLEPLAHGRADERALDGLQHCDRGDPHRPGGDTVEKRSDLRQEHPRMGREVLDLQDVARLPRSAL
jgi:hypothetical protein